MTSEEKQQIESLLEYHLDLLSGDQRAAIEAAILRNPAIREKSDRLGQMLRPLDYWTVPATSRSLEDKVLAKIQARALVSESQQLSFSHHSNEEPSTYRRPGFRWRNVIAAAASIAIILTIAGPVLSNVRFRSQQARCMANLGSVFQGVKLYQAAFTGALPYAGEVAGSTWLPDSTSDRPMASNSRHMFMLTKYNYGPKPEHFVCPSLSCDSPMAMTDLAKRRDFARTCNVSYASLNLAGTTPNLRPRTSIAYLSDTNPLFVGGRFNRSLDPDTVNSPAHRGRGQVVLMLDGTVSKLASPIYGNKADNLWLAGNLREYTGTETPTSDTDAFLVPGFPTSAPANAHPYAR